MGAPSCFEALSLGTHVVQPSMPAPQLIKNKPITQNWTSQHPYLEHIPEPFVFTVDPHDKVSIARAFDQIKGSFETVYSAGSQGNASLREFYSAGVYPKSHVYALDGFLARVARVVRRTTPLVFSDWQWEL